MHAKIERQIDLELRSISTKFSRRAKGKEKQSARRATGIALRW
jgi:hypothetical protein